MISKLICNTDSNIYHIMLSLLQIFEGDAKVRNIIKYDFPFFFMHKIITKKYSRLKVQI
jgi:hypothetical protein